MTSKKLEVMLHLLNNFGGKKGTDRHCLSLFFENKIINFTHFTFVLILFTSTLNAQTTAIPDYRFERALIDLKIDTDNKVNGLVATADIMNIKELNLSKRGIYDLIGIEGFKSLEVINVSDNKLGSVALTKNSYLRKLFAIIMRFSF